MPIIVEQDKFWNYELGMIIIELFGLTSPDHIIISIPAILHYIHIRLPEDDSDIGSPGVDGPPIMPEDPYAYIMAAYEVPPSPDYIPGPEVPPSPDYIPGPEGPPSPDYVPGPEEPEQAPPSPRLFYLIIGAVNGPGCIYHRRIEVFLAEESPSHAATSPTARPPGYITRLDP
ncbi:hypothetical protein Tco_1030605 [Tanacetum coccineum]|uniref:Uncharacterized protein n=1 Tax=Tanacetum coccineum TaxID=301880 RepID=A0ABQ5G6W1_9ASTR